MDQTRRLEMAAQCGDMDTLYTLIQEDPYLLERIDLVPFVDTPLHVAASAGHIQFSMEMMRLKASYARKPNQHGFSPIHLALQNGHTILVLRFIEVDRELVRVQGREGLAPLHFVVAEGNYVDLLAEFLAACPKSIQDLTIQKETALHIAVKNDNLEGLTVLLGWLEHVDKDVVLKWTDDEGNTILHIAVSMNQIEMVRLLVSRVELNAKNLKGLTALDILQEQSRSENELKIILRRAGALKGSSVCSVPILSDSLKKKMSWYERKLTHHYRKKLYMSNEDRNVILVVAVLIAAANYQAILTNPSDKSPSNNTASNTAPTNYYDDDYDDEHTPRSIADYVYDYSDLDKVVSGPIFSFFNTIAFLASMIEIYLHLPRGNGVLKLVLALVIMDTLVRIVTSDSMTIELISCVFLFLFCKYFSKFPVVLNKFIPMIKYKRSMELKRSLFKHCLSFHRDLSA